MRKFQAMLKLNYTHMTSLLGRQKVDVSVHPSRPRAAAVPSGRRRVKVGTGGGEDRLPVTYAVPGCTTCQRRLF